MKALLTLLAVSAILLGCNAITDPGPEDPLVPDSVLQLVENTYDNPQNIIFTEILEKRIWNVEFESRAKRYSSIVSPDNIKVSYWLVGPHTPDSLKAMMNTSAVEGGTFSNFKEEEYISFRNFSYEKAYLADYIWKEKSYLLKWVASFRGGQKLVYDLDMSSSILQFPTADLVDLPLALKQYFQKKEFNFLRATVCIDSHSEKSYQVWLSKNNYDFLLIFDKDCNLVAGSDQPVRIDDARELPENIKAFINNGNQNKDFGFEVKIGGIGMSELDGVKSYAVTLQKLNAPSDNTDTWYILFDQNAKPLLSNYYCTLR